MKPRNATRCAALRRCFSATIRYISAGCRTLPDNEHENEDEDEDEDTRA